jgi:hypothetical protein
LLTTNKESSQKKVLRLLARCGYEGKLISPKKYAKLETEIERYFVPKLQLGNVVDLFRCGEEIRSLQRFTDAQRMAFHKILKKYKVCENLKWLSPSSLADSDHQITEMDRFYIAWRKIQ